MFKNQLWTVLLIALMVTAGHAQDLNRLQSRAQKLLDLRSSLKTGKVTLSEYVEAKSRAEYLELSPLPMQDAQVIGLEFTPDPKVVYVLFKAKVMLPDIGPVPRTGKEPWVWDNKDWFLRLEEIGSGFPGALDKTAEPVPSVKPLPLEFSTETIDLGRHTQGEFLKGVMSFKSDRDELKLLRPPDLPGVAFSAPVWKSNEEAEIEFQVDTGLLSEGVHYAAEFEANGFSEQRTRRAFQIVAQVDPRMRFTQVPPVFDPEKPGKVEVHVENLSNMSFSFTRAYMTNDAYRLVNEPPEVVRPGQTVIFAYTYNSQGLPPNAQLQLSFSEPVLGKRGVVFPFQIKEPPPIRPGYTRQELEEFIRRSK